MDADVIAPGTPHGRVIERRAGDDFLFATSLVLFLYCVVAFILRAATDPGTQERLTPVAIFHAALTTGWLALFAWQVSRRRAGRIATHMRHGRAGAWLAALLVPVGIYASWAAGAAFGSRLFFLGNAFAFLAFGLLVVLAVRAAMARRYLAHSRFMLMATLIFTGPAGARLLAVADAPEALAPALLLLWLVAVPLVFDRLQHGRWQKASMAGTSIVIAALALAMGLDAALPPGWLDPL